LIEGLDESPEELRVKAVTTLAAGNVNEYVRFSLSQGAGFVTDAFHRYNMNPTK